MNKVDNDSLSGCHPHLFQNILSTPRNTAVGLHEVMTGVSSMRKKRDEVAERGFIKEISALASNFHAGPLRSVKYGSRFLYLGYCKAGKSR